MAVNETIWGTKSDWKTSSISGQTTMTTDDKYKLYQGNFGQTEQTYFKSGSLLKGLQSGKLKVDTPIDNSMSYCALGAESPFSKIAYYDRSLQSIVATDSRTITNFCFATSLNIGISSNPIAIRQYLGSSPSSTEWTTDRRSRWAPYAKNPLSPTDTNYVNAYIEPLLQFSPKNFVLLLYVTVCADLNNENDKHTYTLNEYLSSYTTTYPYITNVSAKPCFSNTDITNRNSDSVNANTPMVCVFDTLSIGALLHNSDNEPLTGYIDYDIAGGANKQILIMGVGKTDSIGEPSNGVIIKNTSTTVNYFTPIFGDLTQHTISETKSRFYMNYSVDNIEKIRRAVACFGLFFTGDLTTAQTGDYTDPEMYMGVLDNFVGNGDYTKGVYNVKNPQFDWNNTSDSTYNPQTIDPNTYRNTSGFNNVINAPRDFNRRYVLSASDVGTLNTDFFAALSGVQTSEILQKAMEKFYVNNPIDCIVSLKWFPFSLPTYGSSQTVKLGVYNTTVSAYQYVGSGVEVYNLGECLIYPHFGMGVFGGTGPCFLDYEPYTHIELIVPYCGTVKINPSDFMNCKLRVMMTVDVYTGSCTAYIQRNGLTVDSISGTISVDLPVSGVETATLDSQVHTATNNFKMAKVQEAMTVVSSALRVATNFDTSKGQMISISGGANALADAVMSTAIASENLANTKYDLEHINVPFKSVGSNSGLNGAKAEQFCSLNITRPVLHSGFNADTYGHTVGYACLENGTLSTYSGYTVVSDIDLTGINATADEKNMILNAVKGGVYL